MYVNSSYLCAKNSDLRQCVVLLVKKSTGGGFVGVGGEVGGRSVLVLSRSPVYFVFPLHDPFGVFVEGKEEAEVGREGGERKGVFCEI